MADTNGNSTIFGREPVLWMAAIQGVIACAIGFGLHWTTEQMGLVLTMTGAILALIARSQVTPQAPQNVNDLRNYIEKASPDVIQKAGVKVDTRSPKTLALLFAAGLSLLCATSTRAEESGILALDRFNAGPVVGATVYDLSSAGVPNEFGAFFGGVATYELTSRWNLNAYAEREFVAGDNLVPHWRMAVGPGVMLPGSNDSHQWWLAFERTWYEFDHAAVQPDPRWVVRLQWSFGTPDSHGRDWSYAAVRARYDIDIDVPDYSAKWQPQLIGTK